MAIQVIDRAVGILSLLSHGEPVPLTAIARSLGLALSTTSRILSSLASHELVEQDPSGKYRLGSRLLLLASGVRHARDLSELARPVLRRLVKQTGEDVGIAVLEQDRAVVIDSLYGPHALKIIQPRADSFTLNCGFRKILLSYQNDEWIERYLRDTRFPAYTKNVAVRRAAIWNEIRRIRENGYALSRGEGIEDAGGVAAPVFNGAGVLAACVFVTAPLSRLTTEITPKIVRHVLEASQSITALLAHTKREVGGRSNSGYTRVF